MRPLIVLVLTVVAAGALPAAFERELDGGEPSPPNTEDNIKKVLTVEPSDTSREQITRVESDTTLHRSEEKADDATELHSAEKTEDDDYDEEPAPEDTDEDEGPAGLELIALFAMKVQPAETSSLFDFPMVLPFEVFQRGYNSYRHGHMHHGRFDVLPPKK